MPTKKKPEPVPCERSDCFGCLNGICQVLKFPFEDKACPFFKDRFKAHVEQYDLYGEITMYEWEVKGYTDRGVGNEES